MLFSLCREGAYKPDYLTDELDLIRGKDKSLVRKGFMGADNSLYRHNIHTHVIMGVVGQFDPI